MKNSKLKSVINLAGLNPIEKGEMLSLNEQLTIKGGSATGWQPGCVINVGCTINSGCPTPTPTPAP